MTITNNLFPKSNEIRTHIKRTVTEIRFAILTLLRLTRVRTVKFYIVEIPNTNSQIIQYKQALRNPMAINKIPNKNIKHYIEFYEKIF